MKNSAIRNKDFQFYFSYNSNTYVEIYIGISFFRISNFIHKQIQKGVDYFGPSCGKTNFFVFLKKDDTFFIF